MAYIFCANMPKIEGGWLIVDRITIERSRPLFKFFASYEKTLFDHLKV
jgi:hypothetical protein